MAGKRPVGRPFKKGQVANPKGSSARKRLLKETARLTAQQVHEVAAVILHGNQDDLKALAKNPEATVLQMWTASLVAKSIQKGDSQVYRVLMERLLGKPKETIDLGSDPARPVVMEHKTIDEKLARLAELRCRREHDGDD